MSDKFLRREGGKEVTASLRERRKHFEQPGWQGTEERKEKFKGWMSVTMMRSEKQKVQEEIKRVHCRRRDER